MLPLTEATPKVLLPVAGQPLLGRQLSWLADQGVQKVVMCLGHLAGRVGEYIRDSGWLDRIEITISDEGQAALGTAGAVRLALERGMLPGRFLTLYGDCLPAMDLHDGLRRWTVSGLPAMLSVYTVASGQDGAVARVEGERVTLFSRSGLEDEACRLTHGDYGLAGFTASLFDHLPVGVRSGFGSIHKRLAEHGMLMAFHVDGGPREVGSQEGLAALERLMQNDQQGL
jgi:NDP-sugar pyrophosphorylase family protein